MPFHCFKPIHLISLTFKILFKKTLRTYQDHDDDNREEHPISDLLIDNDVLINAHAISRVCSLFYF